MEDLYNSNLKTEFFDAIIIGSGLGGLTTAALLSKANKKVLILERHYVAGGFTHTFKRGKYVWDVGVHYVGQMQNEDSLMRKIFNYVTDDQLKWSFMGAVYDVAIINGEKFEFKAGIQNQIDNLINLFPGEASAIKQYFQLIENIETSTSMFFGEKSMPNFLSNTIGKFLRKKFNKISDLTTYEVLKNITKNEKLISVLCSQCGNYGLAPKKSSFAIHAIIVNHYLNGGNYPIGGASSILKCMLHVIKKNGGKLALKAEVKQIILAGNKAVGVKLINGDSLYAPIIISNTGSKNTYSNLLPSDLKSCKPIQFKLASLKPSTSHICIYLGLDASDIALQLPKKNYWVYNSINFDEDIENHLNDFSSIPPLLYLSFPSAKDPEWPNHHPNMATIQVIGAASYNWVKQWENTKWQKRENEYNLLKESFKEKMLDKIYELIPQIKGHVCICEISTPLTTRHFSNYSSGEIYGLEHTPERFRQNWLRVHTPVKNLYLTGQDIVTVGIGGALFSGVLTASSILKKNFLWSATRYHLKKDS